jgi:hypothetical protein
MKSLIKFYLITLCLSLTLVDCNEKKPDNAVVITYQHLANFQSWSLNGKGGGDVNGMWHVYMIRGVVNNGKDAQPFDFDLQKLSTEHNETVISSNAAMLNAAPVAMPVNFTATVKPQEVYSIPFGNGALFFIKQEKDTEKTPVTHLFYKKIENGKKVIQGGVIMSMLDATQPVMYGELDQAFLEQIHAKQNQYESAYDAGGKKH